MEQLVILYKSGNLRLTGKLAPLLDSGAFWELKRSLYEKQWVVYAKDPFGNPASVLEYLKSKGGFKIGGLAWQPGDTLQTIGVGSLQSKFL